MTLNRENHTTYDAGFATMLAERQADEGMVESSSSLTEEGKRQLRERYGDYDTFAEAISDYVQEYDLKVSVPHSVFCVVAAAYVDCSGQCSFQRAYSRTSCRL